MSYDDKFRAMEKNRSEAGEVEMPKWIVYYFRGGVKFQGTEEECKEWIEKQTVPENYWKEKA